MNISEGTKDVWLHGRLLGFVSKSSPDGTIKFYPDSEKPFSMAETCQILQAMVDFADASSGIRRTVQMPEIVA